MSADAKRIVDRAIYEIEEAGLSSGEFVDALKLMESEARKRREEFEESEAAA